MVDLRWCCVKPLLLLNFLWHFEHANSKLDMVIWELGSVFLQFCDRILGVFRGNLAVFFGRFFMLAMTYCRWR